MNVITLVFYYCIGKKQHILASLRKAEQNIFVPSGLATGVFEELPKVKAEYTELLGEDRSLVKKALSLVLYVCSDEAEIRDRDAPDWEPSFPRPKVTKGVERLFPADRNRTVKVGRELGAMLREGTAKSEPSAPTGRSVRPHMRRGHWHGFWTGPRKENRDQQKFVLKWLPPLFVHGKNI